MEKGGPCHLQGMANLWQAGRAVLGPAGVFGHELNVCVMRYLRLGLDS
jgi:hypothetical protein